MASPARVAMPYKFGSVDKLNRIIELNSVYLNLLRDILENEESVRTVRSGDDEKLIERLLSDRIERRRELVAEIKNLLRSRSS